MIWADTLRQDHLDAYGYGRETAPRLRQFASDGVLFHNNTTQATWTKVATPSMLTSLYPSTHGVTDFNDRLPAAATTLAEVYPRGRVRNRRIRIEPLYRTVHQPASGLRGAARRRLAPESGLQQNVARIRGSAHELARSAPRRSVLRFPPRLRPHDPFEPGRPYDTMWADPAKREKHHQELEALRKVISDPLLKLFGMPSRAELVKAGIDADAYVKHDVDWYDGSIRGLDTEMDRLFERLKGLGLDDRTMVVFTADHGEEFLDHGRTFHGQTVYGELTQVPLMMRWPGVLPAGRVVDDVVQTIDIMPTLLAISGLPAPAEAQGQSLVPLIRPREGAAGPSWWPRPAISEKAITNPAKGAAPAAARHRGICHRRWRLEADSPYDASWRRP